MAPGERGIEPALRARSDHAPLHGRPGKVDLRLLATGPVLLSLAAVTVLAIVGKLAGAGLAARKLGRRGALAVGIGMVPRGEVGVIVAGIGERAGVLLPATYAVIVGMSLLTSVLAPPALGRLLSREDTA